jgi:CRISPR-associated protein Cmr6
MPIAAVPAYLGKDFKDASPALRFGMYLPIWTDRHDQERDVHDRAAKKSREGDEVRELLNQGMDHAINVLRDRRSRPLPGLWEKNDFGAKDAWRKVIALSRDDQECMDGLLKRQMALAATDPSPHLLRLSTTAVAPFTTGLGNEHPLENGFAFLNPYGLPYLPGSGVKGVLRQAAKELASGEWGDGQGWSEQPRYRINVGTANEPGWLELLMIDVLFGRETASGDKDHVRGALSFWDVIPQIEGDHLMVEIMTPHQSHYYQKDSKKGAGSSTPHDSGQPNPISFLTLPPGSQFTFHIVCDVAHLDRLTAIKGSGAPDLLAQGKTHWKTLLDAAFQHAFTWLGFGAKTAVGYGAMERVTDRPDEPWGTQDTVGLPRSTWVDDKLAELRSKGNVKPDDALRGKTLAEAVRAIEDEQTRREAVADIVNRWKEKGWWDKTLGGSAKQAKAIYDELLRPPPES